MSTNSKFLRNRISKLIGKPTQLKENIPRSDQKEKPNPTKIVTPSPVTHEHTTIRLQSREKVHSTFLCFSDTRVYRDFSFPTGRQMLYDNDEESNFHQIRQDILRGHSALKKELDCSLSDFTIQSSESA